MSNWIDVNKQLPEEGVRVLAYHADGEQWIMVYSPDRGFRCPMEDWSDDVTHWQPLPAAPKTLNLDLVKLAKEPGKRSYAAENCDLFLATHFIEHLSNDHFVRLAYALDAAQVPYIYFEAPITEHGNTWEGYPGTHMLTMGWGHIEKLLSNYAMAEIAPGCMLFTRKP